MTALLESLSNDLQKERADALARYRKLIHASTGEVKPAQTQELRQLMQTLGKGVDDVRRDLKAAADYRALRSEWETAPRLDAERDAATKRFNDYLEEMRRTQAAMAQKRFELHQAMDGLNRAAFSASNVEEKLLALHQGNPDLLDYPVPPAALATPPLPASPAAEPARTDAAKGPQGNPAAGGRGNA